MGEDLETLLGLYCLGNYGECVSRLSNLLHTRHGIVEMKLMHKGTKEKLVQEFIFSNNIAVCQSINKLMNNESGDDWLDSMNYFTNIYSKYRSLSNIPLELELNHVFNMLWWFLIKPQCLQYKTMQFKILLNSVSNSLIKVLKAGGEVVLGPLGRDSAALVALLQQASHLLLQLPASVSSQLLGIIALSALVLQQSPDECQQLPLLNNIVQQLPLLKLHLVSNHPSANEKFFFRFGLTQVNSTASMKNSYEIVEGFVITSSILFAVNGDIELSKSCLENIPNLESNSFHFLVNYLKAYCCLHKQQWNEAKLSLAYNANVQSPLYQTHYCLLLGCVFSAEGDHKAALVQFETALSLFNRKHLSILAANLAASEAFTLQLSVVQLTYLKQLVEYLKESSTEIDGAIHGFEELCLHIMSQQFSITLPEAVYTLARQLYINGYHMKALDTYNELLDLLKSATLKKTKTLPHKVQILQEAAMAHIKAKSFAGGEKICHQLIMDHIPTNKMIQVTEEKKEGCWETVLYSLEEDVIAILLLSDVLASSDKIKALKELNRSYNALSEAREKAEEMDDAEVRSELCDWLLSRTLLRKARLSSSTEDTVHYFRRALLHNPGDKEVMYHYKHWALWHPDHQSWDPGDTVLVFPIDQTCNLALKHVLGCSVSDEEWAAVCDQQSSHNLLESLFQDDD